MLKVCNSFSINMLAALPAVVNFKEINGSEAADLVKMAASAASLESCVGHADTAAVFSAVLGLKIDPVRTTVTMTPHDGNIVLVGQYSGPRLAEGTTLLPEGATIKWVLVNSF
jgi:hypothetical protein